MTPIVSVTGPVEAAKLGIVDCHDHLLIRPGVGPASDPQLHLTDYAEATAEAAAFRDAGGGAIVDAMPTSCGRDAQGLAHIAQATGVTVIATAGFHTSDYYHPQHWAHQYSAEQQAELLHAEITQGIDRYDYAGPIIERLDIRPGVLKVATPYNSIDDFAIRAIEIVGAVHDLCGLPLLTHAAHGTIPDRQISAIIRAGVPPDRVAISHVDRNPDGPLLAEVASTGAYLLFDGLGRESYRPMSMVIAAIIELIDRGYKSKVLLGADVAKRSLRRASGGPGISGLVDVTIAALRRERIPESDIELMTTTNAVTWLTGSTFPDRE